jgi:hypothetical protein
VGIIYKARKAREIKACELFYAFLALALALALVFLYSDEQTNLEDVVRIGGLVYDNHKKTTF